MGSRNSADFVHEYHFTLDEFCLDTKYKFRGFNFILYPDATNYNCNQVIRNLEALSSNGFYAWILHDCDTLEDGTPKRSHIHVNLYLASAQRPCVVFAKLFHDAFNVDWRKLCWGWEHINYDSDDIVRKYINYFGIRDHFEEYLNSVVHRNVLMKMISRRGSLRYLIHLDDLEKFQYDPTEIHSNFEVAPYLRSELLTNAILLEINDWINSQRYISSSALLMYLADSQYSSVYSRFSFLIHSAVKEHNALITGGDS